MAYDLKYGGYTLQTTGTPAASLGQNGDVALDTTTAGGPFIYVKGSSGTWGNSISLKGTAGVAGNLVYPVVITGARTVTSADFANGTPVFVVNAATANVPLTADAAVLWNSTTGASLVFGVKRIDSSTTYTATIVAGGTSETIDNATSYTIPQGAQSYREVIAYSATALLVR